MTRVESAPTSDLSAIAQADGTFAMLAIDQRESLRTLLLAAGQNGSDDDLARFKVAVSRSLSEGASGILVDRDYGLEAIHHAGAIGAGCGLIVAVDRLIQARGGPLEGSALDHDAMTPELHRYGARALKFLVVWRPDQEPGPRRDMVGAFVEGCRRLGLLSVLEGLVQVPGETAGPVVDAAILAAAEEFSEFRPDLYKTHVPTFGLGTAPEIERLSREVTEVIGRPWVVLSAGVPVDRFAMAVEAAGRGGSSGFLAGRGVWGPSIGADDPVADLVAGARQRFQALTAAASAAARPWFAADPA